MSRWSEQVADAFLHGVDDFCKTAALSDARRDALYAYLVKDAQGETNAPPTQGPLMQELANRDAPKQEADNTLSLDRVLKRLEERPAPTVADWRPPPTTLQGQPTRPHWGWGAAAGAGIGALTGGEGWWPKIRNALIMGTLGGLGMYYWPQISKWFQGLSQPQAPKGPAPGSFSPPTAPGVVVPPAVPPKQMGPMPIPETAPNVVSNTNIPQPVTIQLPPAQQQQPPPQAMPPSSLQWQPGKPATGP